MYQIILLFHVFAAVCIIALVLVQQGKGASMGAAFGSGASQTVFGSRGSGSFLFRVTLSFAAIFFISSIGLNNIATRAFRHERVVTVPVLPVPANRAQSEAPGTNAAGQLPANPVMPTTSPDSIPARK
jgi:preprotein translocase subunit SecG